MLYNQKRAFFPYAVLVALARAADECVDIWAIGRCTSQKRKGNCAVCRVVELDDSTSRSICSALNLSRAPRPLAPIFAPTHARLRPTPEQPEAQCPNPKKDGIKCTRARSQCMATCRLCDDDSASSCTSPPPPTPPPGADYPCDTAYELRTLTQAYDWYAPHEEEEHASNSSDSYMRASATP